MFMKTGLKVEASIEEEFETFWTDFGFYKKNNRQLLTGVAVVVISCNRLSKLKF